MAEQDFDDSLVDVEQDLIVNNRVLAVDDDEAVLNLYQDLFDDHTLDLNDFNFFPPSEPAESTAWAPSTQSIELTCAHQGREALELVQKGIEEEAPYAAVFLDMRMPPGWDGLETAQKIREVDDSIYIVFVSAYSDRSIDEMQDLLHKNTLLLNKPFSSDEVLQMARTLCISWAREQCLLMARRRLSQLSIQMARRANLDALTTLYNRYYLDRQMSQELKRARCEQQPLALLMIDIDWFKIYNDQHGHLAGDRALQQIARALLSVARRPADFVARYGGEEFCVVLPNTDCAGLALVAERARGAVDALQLEFVDQLDAGAHHLTISVGGVSRVPKPSDTDTAMIDEADRFLYQAKAAGKNRALIGSPC